MTEDFIPHSYANLIVWLQNLSLQYANHGAALGMTAPEIAAAQGIIAQLVYKVNAVLAAEVVLDAAVAAYRASAKSATTGLPSIRKTIAKAKLAPGYTPAIGEAMQAIGHEIEVDPDTYKPVMTAEAMPGHVRIRGRKKGVEAMNIYRRLRGQTVWQLATSNRTKFPWDDDAPLAVAGVAEVREYSVIGVIAGDEVGQRSDLAVVTYGG